MSGHLKKNAGGHLTKNAAGHLVYCPVCSCTVPAYTGCGSCTTSDYGTPANQGDASVVVSGTYTAYPMAISGVCNGVMPGSCPSVNASYIIPCGTTITYYHAVFVCYDTGANLDWYYGVSIRFTYPNASNQIAIRVTAVLGSQTHGNTNDAATLSTTPWNLLVHTARTRTLVYGDAALYYTVWRYVNSGSCNTSCNETMALLKCLSGSQGVLSDTNNYGGSYSNNGCNIAALSFAVGIS